MLPDAARKPIFDAAKARGAVFKTMADVAAMNVGIDAAMTMADAPLPTPASATYTKPISLIDASLMKIACPENNLTELALWVEPTKAACKRWGIDTLREIASFLANIGVESAGLTRLSENMNYSAKRMAEVWPGRFAVNPSAAIKARQPNALAKSLEHNPEKLANHVYANRLGNGPPESGDGWRYRGYGPKQLTGAYNQAQFAKAAGISLKDVPAYLQTKDGGMMSAGWFWFDNGLDAMAATAGIEDDRKAINGGLIGVDEVRARFNALISELLKREKQ